MICPQALKESTEKPSVSKKRKKTNVTPKSTLPKKIKLNKPAERRIPSSELDVKTLTKLIQQCKNPSNLVFPHIRRLQKSIPVMIKLNNIVGQASLKSDMVKLFLSASKNCLHKDKGMINFCLYGKPGLGKTTIIKIIAEALVSLGLLPETDFNKKEKYIIGTCSNMIGQYLGQTAPMTDKLIQQCVKEGKVLLLDEAYQFSSKQGDRFSKKMLDTLTQRMEQFSGQLFVCMSGYKKDIQTCFFGKNPGFERRFRFCMTLEDYSPAELRAILLLMMKKQKLTLADDELDATVEWFSKHMSKFPFAGGDVETLLLHAQQACDYRTFCLSKDHQRVMYQPDFETGIKALEAKKSGSNFMCNECESREKQKKCTSCKTKECRTCISREIEKNCPGCIKDEEHRNSLFANGSMYD